MKRRVKKRAQHKNCLKCGRTLTDTVSIVRGMGPTCFGQRPSLLYAELEEQGQLRFQI